MNENIYVPLPNPRIEFTDNHENLHQDVYRFTRFDNTWLKKKKKEISKKYVINPKSI